MTADAPRGPPPRERATRKLLLTGAVTGAAGLAIAAMAPIVGVGAPERIHAQQTIGGVALVVGWAILLVAIHRLGREPP